MTSIRRLRPPWVLVGIMREDDDDRKPVVGVIAFGMVGGLCGAVTWRKGARQDEPWSPFGSWFSPMGEKVTVAQMAQADESVPREPPWENWPTSPGAQLIAQERERQILEEGYTTQHDDRHTDWSMARAAACYAMAAAGRTCFTHVPGTHRVAEGWPWDKTFDKRPGEGATLEQRGRALEKAGALIAAELDRVLRALGELEDGHG